MKIIFGMDLDGTKWSEGVASVGQAVFGPLGMLRYLEPRLGFSRPELSSSERLAVTNALRRREGPDGGPDDARQRKGS